MSDIDKRLFGEGLLGAALPKFDSELKKKFVFPPFSVWSARDELWQGRRRKWLNLGIESELGRDTPVYTDISYRKVGKTQTSVFDPVVCELCYRWFCPPGGKILDPFAGGSVRGVVASCLGYRYCGIDLSQKQVDANWKQISDHTTGEVAPVWICADSEVKLRAMKNTRVDMVFSCPPYGNLEEYSNHPDDLSNMDYKQFVRKYRDIVLLSAEKLHNNRFAAFVVANFRDKKSGVINDLVGDTVQAFKSAGLDFYNDIVLIHPCGSAPVRASNTFERGNRKVVKLHQNVLIFVKGSPPSWEIESTT